MLRRLEERFRRSRSKTATKVAKPQPSSSSPSSRSRKSKSSEQHTMRKTSSSSSEPALGDYPSTISESNYKKMSNSESSSSSGGGGIGSISFSTHSSLSSLRESLPENPNIYDISEIRAATNNFLAKRHTSSSSASSVPSWRCTLRGKEVVIFQRKLHKPASSRIVRDKLSSVCKSHHSAIVKLIGASISGDYLYLVYEYVPGSSLVECLRNPNNPSFTVLSNWMSRIQIATDLADGLDYIHNNTGMKNVRLVHNHIKTSSVIVVEQQREDNCSYNAKICHFGTAQLCGEAVEEGSELHLRTQIEEIDGEIEVDNEDNNKESSSPKFRQRLVRSNSVKFQGTRGYMSPEFQQTGIGTVKSDVYAFGAVILELLSGEEPLRFKFDKKTGNYANISVVDFARAAIEGSGDDGGGGTEGRLRQWLDKRLKDSFPVEVVEKLTRLALDCVHVEADKRPDMRRVAGKISKFYLESKNWSDRINMPSEITVSLGPR